MLMMLMNERGSIERRQTRRIRSLKEGKVVLDDWRTIDCVIREMSDGGARLEFPTVANLPVEFRLLVVSTNTLAPAARVWQRGSRAGIKFTGPAKPAPARQF